MAKLSTHPQAGLELLSLGALSSRVPRDEAIDALEQLEPRQAADFFRRHKVRTLADRRLADIPTERATEVRSALSASVRFIAGRFSLCRWWSSGLIGRPRA